METEALSPEKTAGRSEAMVPTRLRNPKARNMSCKAQACLCSKEMLSAPFICSLGTASVVMAISGHPISLWDTGGDGMEIFPP